MILADAVLRRVPGGWSWWRVFVEIAPRRGTFEDGIGWSYAGCIHRWGRRIGPVNVAFLRLIGDRHDPYRADRHPAPPVTDTEAGRDA